MILLYHKILISYPAIRWGKVFVCFLSPIEEPGDEKGDREHPEDNGIYKPHVPTHIPRSAT